MGLRRMMMFTLGVNLVNTIIKNLKNFIATITVKNGVTFEAEQCTVNELTDLQNQLVESGLAEEEPTVNPDTPKKKRKIKVEPEVLDASTY